MKKQIAALLLCILLFTSCSARTPSPAQTPGAAGMTRPPNVQPAPTLPPEQTPTPTGENVYQDDDARVVYRSHELIQDSAGNDALKVVFSYTNISGDTAVPALTVGCSAYQNEEVLEVAVVSAEDEALDMRMERIQPDTTVEAAFCFKLQDKSPVELVVSDLLGLGKNRMVLTLIPE